LSQETFTNTPLSVKKLVLLVLSMKKTALALALVITVLIVFGVQSVELVEANAYTVSWTNNGPPIMTIESPLNNEIVSFSDVVFAFTLTRPGENWTSNRVDYVNIALDGKLYRKVEVNFDLSVPFTYSFNLTDLKEGSHIVQLNAFCKGVITTVLSPGILLSEEMTSYNSSSDIINFIIDTPEPTPSPTPITAPTTPTVAPESTPKLLDPAVSAYRGVALLVLSVAVPTILLLYFNKRQRDKSP
jgi:hypothetical protein